MKFNSVRLIISFQILLIMSSLEKELKALDDKYWALILIKEEQENMEWIPFINALDRICKALLMISNDPSKTTHITQFEWFKLTMQLKAVCEELGKAYSIVGKHECTKFYKTMAKAFEAKLNFISVKPVT